MSSFDDLARSGRPAVEDGMIWCRKVRRQMTLTARLASRGVDHVLRDVTGRHDDERSP